MSKLNYQLKWHPQFTVEDANTDHVLFLGGKKQYLFPKKDYNVLSPIINRGGKLSDYIFSSTNLSSNINAIEQIDKLVENGILLKDQETFEYKQPNFITSYKTVIINSNSVLLLSNIVTEEFLHSYFSTLNIPQNICLVIVDDYLDERLIEINNNFHKQETSWILCQLSGEHPMIGPVLTPVTNSVFNSLRNRLKQNQPVREWLSRIKKQTVKIPVLKNLVLQKKVAEIFQKEFLTNWDVLNFTDKVFTYNDVDDKGTFHQTPINYNTQIDQEIQLESVVKKLDNDGGYRQCTRQETIDKLLPIISPLTGLIAELKELTSNNTNNGLSIYQAAYFQNSFQKQLVTADTFVQLSLGKGVANEQAITSALGEALERQAAQFQGTEKNVFDIPKNLDYPAFIPQKLTPFSKKQYKEFEKYNTTSLKRPQWVKPYDSKTPINWIKGWSLTRNSYTYFPFSYCYANTPHKDHYYSLYSHNGNAAGNSKEEAILQGLLEVIERDAVAIWWYNQIPRPGINLYVVPKEQIDTIDKTLADDWDYWLLDVSNDIKVLTTVAVGKNKTTGKFVMGFGSHLNPSIACSRALTEMYQLIMIKDKVTGPFDFNAITNQPYLLPAKKISQRNLSDFEWKNNADIKENIIYLKNLIQVTGHEVCVLNYTRPENPLHTVKVIVPGLCHFWPQLANERLYDVPVKMKWLSFKLEEEELNPIDLYL